MEYKFCQMYTIAKKRKQEIFAGQVEKEPITKISGTSAVLSAK